MYNVLAIEGNFFEKFGGRENGRLFQIDVVFLDEHIHVFSVYADHLSAGVRIVGNLYLPIFSLRGTNFTSMTICTIFRAMVMVENEIIHLTP